MSVNGWLLINICTENDILSEGWNLSDGSIQKLHSVTTQKSAIAATFGRLLPDIVTSCALYRKSCCVACNKQLYLKIICSCLEATAIK